MPATASAGSRKPFATQPYDKPTPMPKIFRYDTPITKVPIQANLGLRFYFHTPSGKLESFYKRIQKAVTDRHFGIHGRPQPRINVNPKISWFMVFEDPDCPDIVVRPGYESISYRQMLEIITLAERQAWAFSITGNRTIPTTLPFSEDELARAYIINPDLEGAMRTYTRSFDASDYDALEADAIVREEAKLVKKEMKEEAKKKDGKKGKGKGKKSLTERTNTSSDPPHTTPAAGPSGSTTDDTIAASATGPAAPAAAQGIPPQIDPVTAHRILVEPTSHHAPTDVEERKTWDDFFERSRNGIEALARKYSETGKWKDDDRFFYELGV